MASKTAAQARGTFLGVPAVPRLGLGLASLGRPGYINIGHNQDLRIKTVEGMQEHCGQVLEEAHALGIRYFDAARSYGKAEEFLSTWIRSKGYAKAPAGPSSIIVGSKWGYTYTADWQIDTGGKSHEVKEHSASNLRKQSAESDKLLGSHLHLYQIHSATLESGVLENAEVLGELEQLKHRLGWKIGLSCSGIKQEETIRMAMTQKMSDGSGPLFDSVQVTWNILEQSAGKALEEAHMAGMDVIVKEGMANGRLLQGKYMEALQAVANKHATSPDGVALAVVMLQPFQPMVLSGATTVEQLRSNMQALQLAAVLSQNDVANLLDMRQDTTMYWNDRSAMAWN